MYDLALQIVVFGSLGFIIYMMARTLPRLQDNIQPPRGPNFVERLFAKIPMSRMDQNINHFFAGFLRKFKVFITKMDAFVNDRLSRLTKKSGGDKVNNDKPQDQPK